MLKSFVLCGAVIVALVTISLAYAAQEAQSDGAVDDYKAEIVRAEQEFAEMAQSRSLREAFLAFAALDAVLLRGKNLVRGHDEIDKYFDQQTLRDVRLAWSPDFVDVSAAGDLGYTYGKYTLTATDADGNEIKDEGVFHTVWKRQPDGTWKFVWD